jgi:hypothetical protein
MKDFGGVVQRSNIGVQSVRRKQTHQKACFYTTRILKIRTKSQHRRQKEGTQVPMPYFGRVRSLLNNVNIKQLLEYFLSIFRRIGKQDEQPYVPAR